MNKNLIPLLLLFISSVSIAQPKSQDLSAIDPRLVNGFTMTALKLTADEYKGVVPTGSSGISDTKTLTGLRKLQTAKLEGNRSKYVFQVIPYFSFNSWLADTVKNNPKLLAKILKHEQNHYDIRLMMANELLKQLNDAWFDNRNYAPGILEIRDKLSKQEQKVNLLYETETSQGINTEAQLKWDALVSNAMQTKNWAVLTDYAKVK